MYDELLQRLTDSWVAQPDKPEESPEITLRALSFAAAGKPLSARLAVAADWPQLDQDGKQALAALVERRCAGVPLAHLSGRQHFLGLEMLAGPEALIPRAETEILGRGALAIAKRLAAERPSVTVIDVCCGAGNVTLGIAAGEPRCRIFGADLWEPAVELARRNARHLGLDRVGFRPGDLLEPFRTEEFLGSVDLVTCNPPYISTAKVASMPAEISNHEPRLAFDGGFLGATILMRLISEAPAFLKPDSYLCFEVGLGQGKGMLNLVKKSKAFRDVEPWLDEKGEVRALAAKT